MRSVLLDTGALVALLDKSERNHKRCLAFFRDFKGKLLTTEPVLTEAVYLLGPSVKAQRACLDFIIEEGAVMLPQSKDSMSRAVSLMEKYSDIPMDYADATLVILAEDIGTNEIFTLDLRGFNSYRIHGRKTFRIWPE